MKNAAKGDGRKEMKLFVWGTGRLAGKVIGRYICMESVTAFIDNDMNKKEYMNKKVLSPKEAAELEYDAIVVVNLYSREIYRQCEQVGIDLDKVIFLYNHCTLQDMNRDYEFIERVLGTEYAEIIRNRYHVVRGVEAHGALFLKDNGFCDRCGGGYLQSDYVRMKCFELAVKEIRKRKTTGETAELGVFRGEFAQYINIAFPDKKLYLFDTFEGFDACEALKEVRNGNATDAFVEAYKQTSIGDVMQKMTYLNQVEIKQGYFPDSLQGLEETFAFVSIDVDFEDSVYEGLKYFYPRLAEGGYIFVHDYNSSLLGVERAVDRFEKEMDGMICKVPLCDANGTLVISK